MKFNEAKAKTNFPKAFHHLDKWFVKNSKTGLPLESAFTEIDAQRAAEIVNTHEVSNNREPVYVVEMFDPE